MITQPVCDQLHAMKYRGEGEDHREAMNRVAYALKDGDEHYHDFREILIALRYMPAGRVQAAMGSTRDVTPYNCFVSGTIEDTFVGDAGWDGDPGGIMRRVWEAAATMRRGGGIGYDFSTLRPRGELIRKLESQSSGPISFMHIYDATCRATSSSGHRRGAQMGVLRIDHPDVMEFIRAKQNTTHLTGFNVSIAITDEFMHCLLTNRPFDLRWGGRVYKTVDAAELWEAAMRSTWDWAEPGVLFIDTINRYNNLYYCETIAATNPCGEQPLPPYGACLLGSFNLVKYLRPSEPPALQVVVPGAKPHPRWYFDWEQLARDIPVVVRAMDNVVDRARYPLPEQRVEANSKRRMGLGVTGLANCIEALGFPYGSAGFVHVEAGILDFIRDESYIASAKIAAEKGPFKLYKKELYCGGEFFKTLSFEAQERVREHGVRNSHLTSIAPTGTISFCADNVSSGLEPVFSYKQQRVLQTFDGPQPIDVEDYGVRELGVRGRVSSQVTIDEHLDVLAAAARRVDSAVSKTCNLPPSTTWDQFKNVYVRAWEMGAKGCTTYNTGGKRGAVLTSKDEDAEAGKPEAAGEGAACTYDPVTGVRSCE